MLREKKSSIKTRRMLFGVILLVLFGTAIALGFANRHLLGRKQDGGIAHVDGREARKPERADARYPDRMSALPAVPHTSAQFDLSLNVIAGGGVTSIGSGNLLID